MTKFEFEEEVPYIVLLKEPSIFAENFHNRICGFLIKNQDNKFHFQLNGSRMLVVIPHEEVQYMFPSKLHFDKAQQEHQFVKESD